MLAIQIGNSEIVRLLLQYGALIDQVGVLGDTPLTMALLKRDVDMAQLLVKEAGAKLDIHQLLHMVELDESVGVCLSSTS